jgi:hypothetical protein
LNRITEILENSSSHAHSSLTRHGGYSYNPQNVRQQYQSILIIIKSQKGSHGDSSAPKKKTL